MADKRHLLEQVFTDPTPNSIITRRIIFHIIEMAQYTDLNEDEQEQFINTLLLTSKKAASVWNHMETYKQEEQALVALEHLKTPALDTAVVRIETSQVLFLEFDEFLVQIKSALDYLVKIPVPVFGRNIWSLRTFGRKGEDVLKALRSNLPKRFHKEASGVSAFLQENHLPWLRDVIHARDKMNHFLDGGISFRKFAVLTDDSGQIRVPMWSEEQTIEQFMSVIWENFFCLLEDFTIWILFFRRKEGYAFLRGRAKLSSPTSPWKVVLNEQYEAEVKKPGWSRIGENDTAKRSA